MPAGKPALERLYLLYAPLWMTTVLLIMATRVFARWGDLDHLLFGIALALPVWLAPFFPPFLGLLGERQVPLAQRYSLKAAVYITLISGLQNYFGTPLLFSRFGLEYHFHVTLSLNGSPLFLTFMTVAYFSTYFAVMQCLLRALKTLLAGRLRAPLWSLLRLLAAAAMSYALALLETLLMANEHLAGYFSYADKQRMMWMGSFCYGTMLFVAILVFVRIDDDEEYSTPLTDVIWRALGANTLVLCAYELYAHFLPPLH